MPSGPRQLDLFASMVGPSEADSRLDARCEADRELMTRVPVGIRLGTSSWTFPGWAGIVYRGKPSERTLVADGLREYARHPLFRTVGIDRSFYRPLDAQTLAGYRAQLPADFRCVIKMSSELTTPGSPAFLDPVRCQTEVLAPIIEHFAAHAGPLVFQFPPMARSDWSSPRDFAQRLTRFFQRLPSGLSYAVEVRNPDLVSRDYFDALAELGVTHVYNFWERMPELERQLEVSGAPCAPFVVARLLLPPGHRYDTRKRALEPFDRIVEVQEKMRADLLLLARACTALGKVLFVIVNNKAEGSSPLTVRALAERIAADLELQSATDAGVSGT